MADQPIVSGEHFSYRYLVLILFSVFTTHTSTLLAIDNPVLNFARSGTFADEFF